MPKSSPKPTPRAKKSIRQDLLVAISAANLMFFKQWSDLTLLSKTVTERELSYEKISASLATYLGLSFDIACFATLLFFSFRVARSFGKKTWVAVHALLALCLLFFVNGVRLSMHLGYLTSRIGESVCTAFVLALVFALGYSVWRHRERSIAALRAFVFIFFPFALVTFSYAVFGAYQCISMRSPRIVATHAKEAETRPKLIWWLFDETDYRMTFLDRPKGLELPELDRLRAESFTAENAYPPGSHTSVSIPSYFSGRHVTEALYVDNNTVKATFEGHRIAENWGSEKNLFDELLARGAQSEVVGWYLPYCSMVHVAECIRFPHYNFFKRPYSEDFSTSALNLIEELGYLRPNRAMFHIETYEAIRKAALASLDNPNIDFSFIHWPAPHAPWIYDRATMQLTSHNRKGPDGYFDNLKLVDVTLGVLRRKMEASGDWDKSTILFTSDHGWNSVKDYDGKKDLRIPYLLKFAGAREGLSYTPSFDALLTKDLWLAIWDREVNSPKTASAWIDARRGSYPIHP